MPKKLAEVIHQASDALKLLEDDDGILRTEFSPGVDSAEQDEISQSEKDSRPNVIFHTRESLSSPSLIQRTTRELSDLIQSGNLNLSPVYQRDVVWNGSLFQLPWIDEANKFQEKCQVELINSLLENYAVPILIFNIHEVDGDHGEKVIRRDCVDGKQRLTSIFKFMNGDLPCTDHDGKKWWYSDKSAEQNSKPKISRTVLTKNVKKRFREITVPCMEYKDLRLDQQRELFARVQKGITLNPAEKFAATSGPFQSFAKTIIYGFPDIVQLCRQGRSLDFSNVLNVCSQINEINHHNANGSNDVPTYRGDAKDISKFIQSHTDFENQQDLSIMQSIRNGFHIWEKVRSQSPEIFTIKVLDPTQTHARKFAPTEFVAVAIIIWLYGYGASPRDRSFGLLKDDILGFRTYIRQHMKEIKNHPDTWKVEWAYIENLRKIRGRLNSTSHTPIVSTENIVAPPSSSRPLSRPRAHAADSEHGATKPSTSPRSNNRPKAKSRNDGKTGKRRKRAVPQRSNAGSKTKTPELLTPHVWSTSTVRPAASYASKRISAQCRLPSHFESDETEEKSSDPLDDPDFDSGNVNSSSQVSEPQGTESDTVVDATNTPRPVASSRAHAPVAQEPTAHSLVATESVTSTPAPAPTTAPTTSTISPRVAESSAEEEGRKRRREILDIGEMPLMFKHQRIEFIE